ncbi:MAG: hypothetical protein ABI441_16035 [Flavobacterium sp.]
MDNLVKVVIAFLITTICLSSCTNENLTPVNEEQRAGKVVIKGYNALQDSIQVSLDGKLLVVDKKDAFLKKIEKTYEFVFYANSTKTIAIINKKTKQVLHSYNFTTAKPVDTLSFYVKENIWIENVLSNKPGTLSAAGSTGYRFIFPNFNLYAKSSYKGSLDAIIRKANGEEIGVVQNITKNTFSTFLEFPFSPPPIINIEIVKHGTTESYVSGKKVVFQTIIQNNKSKIIVLEEKADTNGVFSGVDGTINLTDYFSF